MSHVKTYDPGSITIDQPKESCIFTWYFPCNEAPYEMRRNKIIQPRMKTTTHSLRPFSYIGAKLLNDLLKEIPDICDLRTEVTEYEMKNLIKCWKAPMNDNILLMYDQAGRCSNEWIDFVLALCRLYILAGGFIPTSYGSYASFTTSKCFVFNVSHASFTGPIDWISPIYCVYVCI